MHVGLKVLVSRYEMASDSARDVQQLSAKTLLDTLNIPHANNEKQLH